MYLAENEQKKLHRILQVLAKNPSLLDDLIENIQIIKQKNDLENMLAKVMALQKMGMDLITGGILNDIASLYHEYIVNKHKVGARLLENGLLNELKQIDQVDIAGIYNVAMKNSSTKELWREPVNHVANLVHKHEEDELNSLSHHLSSFIKIFHGYKTKTARIQAFAKFLADHGHELVIIHRIISQNQVELSSIIAAIMQACPHNDIVKNIKVMGSSSSDIAHILEKITLPKCKLALINYLEEPTKFNLIILIKDSELIGFCAKAMLDHYEKFATIYT